MLSWCLKLEQSRRTQWTVNSGGPWVGGQTTCEVRERGAATGQQWGGDRVVMGQVRIFPSFLLFEIFSKLFWNIFETFLKHFWKSFETFLKHFWNIFEILFLGIFKWSFWVLKFLSFEIFENVFRIRIPTFWGVCFIKFIDFVDILGFWIFRGSFLSLVFEFWKFWKCFLNQNTHFWGVCFIKFIDFVDILGFWIFRGSFLSLVFEFWKFWKCFLNQNTHFWGGLFYKVYWFCWYFRILDF